MEANDFFDSARSLFLKQKAECEVYRTFLKVSGRYDLIPERAEQIPFLPISFFRTHQVITGWTPQVELIFRSSGTMGMERSAHYVTDAARYERSLMEGFREAYGTPEEWAILALLPGYIERSDSSLVYMVQRLMEASGAAENGFYLNDFPALAKALKNSEKAGRKTLLIGVTFALLDFAEAYPMPLHYTTIMETGGMKGRREELLREEVHRRLKTAFSVPEIHSEYGMTELLSQAYSREGGLYQPASTLRAFVRDIQDPFSVSAVGQGGLNLIDLANENSCSFIATDDLGIVHTDGRFEVLGRLDFSALRGCSLMAL